MKINVGRDDVIGNAVEICNIKVESPFSREKAGSSPSSSRSMGDNAEVKALVTYAGLGVRKQS